MSDATAPLPAPPAADDRASPTDTHEVAPFLRVTDPDTPKGWSRVALNLKLSWHLGRVALPVVLGMVTQAAINLLDGAMVGYLPKAQANPGQAAIGLALPFMWLVGGGLSAVWVGTQAIASRRAGEGRGDLAGRALTNSLLIASTSSVALSALAYAVAPMVIRALYEDPQVIYYGVAYIQIRMLGVPAMVCTFSYKSFFDGIGKTHVFMFAAVIMNALNVVLNVILIFGWEAAGIPQMGVQGAAYASVFSAYVGLSALALWSCSPNYLRRYRFYSPSKINGGVIREIVRLSLPNSAATVVVMIGFSAFYWVVGQVNGRLAEPGNPVFATASQVVVMAAMPSFMTALGFGTATAAVVGQALGAKRPMLAERYGWEAVKFWSYVMASVGVIIFFFPDAIAWVFNKDPEVIGAARAPLRMIAVLQGIIPMAMILAQTLYGVGFAKYVMGVELVLHVLVMAPVAYLFGLVLDLGLVGIYLGPTLYGVLLAAAMAWKFTRGDWKEGRF